MTEKRKPQGYAILVREAGAEIEVEWGRVQTNPAPIVEGLKAKKIDGYNPKGRRSNLLRYSSVRYITLSIAIAITVLSAPGSLSASPRTYDAQMCRNITQARASFPSTHLGYRIAGGRRCWFPSRRASPTSGQGKVPARAATARAANVSERRDLPVERTGARPSTFNERWILR